MPEPMPVERMEGLYEKFDVFKDGERVEDCFVLRPSRDGAAFDALAAYADAVERAGGNPQLVADLRGWLLEIGR